METIVSLLPYGRQPITIEPEDPAVAATVTRHQPRLPPHLQVPKPKAHHALPTSPPIDRIDSAASPAVASFGAPKRTRSLTFEDERDNEDLRPADEIVLLDEDHRDMNRAQGTSQDHDEDVDLNDSIL
jgi:hypothetical protein